MVGKLNNTKRIKQLRQDILKEQNPYRQSLETVAEVKKSTDEGDALYIYKMNSRKLNPDMPLLLFKTSCIIVEVALKWMFPGQRRVLCNRSHTTLMVCTAGLVDLKVCHSGFTTKL